jgi:hypothetical protein
LFFGIIFGFIFSDFKINIQLRGRPVFRATLAMIACPVLRTSSRPLSGARRFPRQFALFYSPHGSVARLSARTPLNNQALFSKKFLKSRMTF